MTQIELRKNKVEKFFSSDSIKSKLKAFFGNDQKIAKFKSTMEMLVADPNLQNYDPLSVLQCGLKSAEVGLSPLKEIGQTYFVPYQGKLQLQIGYKGWRTLLELSNKVVKEHRVYKCDDFSMTVQGFDEEIILNPKSEEHNESSQKWVQENLKGVLVFVKDMNTGVIHNKFVTKNKLDQMMNFSPAVKSKKKSPWDDWSAEMFSAKAIKYVVSKMPIDERLAKAIQIDNELDIKKQNEKETQSYFAENFIDAESVNIEDEIQEDQKDEEQSQEVPNE